jgi:hypothetical protein
LLKHPYRDFKRDLVSRRKLTVQGDLADVRFLSDLDHGGVCQAFVKEQALCSIDDTGPSVLHLLLPFSTVAFSVGYFGHSISLALEAYEGTRV